MFNLAYEVLAPEKDFCDMFSLIILTDSKKERAKLRTHLIEHQVYPAILWTIPMESVNKKVKEFSERMLSIHCDGRYNKDDIVKLADIINQSLIS